MSTGHLLEPGKLKFVPCGEVTCGQVRWLDFDKVKFSKEFTQLVALRMTRLGKIKSPMSPHIYLRSDMKSMSGLLPPIYYTSPCPHSLLFVFVLC